MQEEIDPSELSTRHSLDTRECQWVGDLRSQGNAGASFHNISR